MLPMKWAYSTQMAVIFGVAILHAACAVQAVSSGTVQEVPAQTVHAGSLSGTLGGLYVEFSLPRGAEPRAPQNIRLILPRDYPSPKSLATTSYITLGYCQHSQLLLDQFLASPYWGKSLYSDMTPVAIQCKSHGFLFLMAHSPQAKANLREGARHTGPEPLLYLFIDHELSALTDWSSIADPLSTLNGSATRTSTELAKRTLGWDLSYATVMAGEKPADVAWLRNWVQSEGVNTASKFVEGWKGDPIVSSVLIEVPALHAGELLQYWLVRTKEAAYLRVYAKKQQRGVANVTTTKYDALYDQISSWKQSPPFPGGAEPGVTPGYLGFVNLYDHGKSHQFLLSMGDFFETEGGRFKMETPAQGKVAQGAPVPGRLSGVLAIVQTEISAIHKEFDAATRARLEKRDAEAAARAAELIRRDEPRQAFLHAVMHNDVASLNAQLAIGTKPADQFDNNGVPALIVAAMLGHEAAVRWLLDHGVDVNTRIRKAGSDFDGDTALMALQSDFSTMQSEWDKQLTPPPEPERLKYMVQLLLARGADVNVANRLGDTALSHALRAGDRLGIIEELLKRGAKVNVKLQDGMTVLMVALETDAGIKQVPLLLDRGADVKVRTRYDVTPLMLAAGNAPPVVVTMLLDRGAGVHTRNIKGSTALHYAVSAGRVDNVKLLLARGSDPSVANKDGDTPLRQAQAQRFEEIVTVLKAVGAK